MDVPHRCNFPFSEPNNSGELIDALGYDSPGIGNQLHRLVFQSLRGSETPLEVTIPLVGVAGH